MKFDSNHDDPQPPALVTFNPLLDEDDRLILEDLTKAFPCFHGLKLCEIITVADISDEDVSLVLKENHG